MDVYPRVRFIQLQIQFGDYVPQTIPLNGLIELRFSPSRFQGLRMFTLEKLMHEHMYDKVIRFSEGNFHSPLGACCHPGILYELATNGDRGVRGYSNRNLQIRLIKADDSAASKFSHNESFSQMKLLILSPGSNAIETHSHSR